MPKAWIFLSFLAQNHYFFLKSHFCAVYTEICNTWALTQTMNTNAFFCCCWYTFLFKSTLLLCMENMIGLGAKPGYRRTHTLLVRGKKHFPGSTPERMDYGRCLFFFIPPQFSKFWTNATVTFVINMNIFFPLKIACSLHANIHEYSLEMLHLA